MMMGVINARDVIIEKRISICSVLMEGMKYESISLTPSAPMTMYAIFSMMGLFLMILMNSVVVNLMASMPTNTPIAMMMIFFVNDTDASILSMLNMRSIISMDSTVAQNDFLLMVLCEVVSGFCLRLFIER